MSFRIFLIFNSVEAGRKSNPVLSLMFAEVCKINYFVNDTTGNSFSLRGTNTLEVK